MEALERQGAKLVFHDATIPDLEGYARDHDLVIVAAGKGEVAQLFERDPSRSPYSAPQRALALTYVTGMTPRPEYSAVALQEMAREPKRRVEMGRAGRVLAERELGPDRHWQALHAAYDRVFEKRGGRAA